MKNDTTNTPSLNGRRGTPNTDFQRAPKGYKQVTVRTFWRQALPGMPATLAPCPTNAVNTVKKCYAARWADVLFVLLLHWLPRALRCPCYFPLGFWALWRACAPNHKTLLCSVFCCVCGSGLACEPRLVVLGPLARARDAM